MNETVKRPDPIYVMRQVSEEVTCATFMTVDNTELLFAGSSDGRIYSWELKTFRLVDSVSAHAPKNVTNLMTWRQCQLLSQGGDGQVKHWCLDKEPAELTMFQEWPCSMFLGVRACLMGDLLAIPCQDGTAVDVVNLDTGLVQYSLPPAPKERGILLAFQLLPPDQLLVTYEDGSIHLMDLTNRQPLTSIPTVKPSKPLFILDTLRDSDILAVGFEGFLAHLIKSGPHLELKTSKDFKTDLNSAVILPPKKDSEFHFAIGTVKGSIKIICTSNLKTVARLNFHTKAINFMVVSPSKQILAACSADSKLTLWSLQGLCGC